MLAGTYAQRLEQTAKGEQELPPAAVELDDQISFDPTVFDFGAMEEEEQEQPETTTDVRAVEGFPAPGAAGTADILKFLIDRTGYIKLLEEEDTPEAFSRVENLHELVNAAMDSRDRGETLDQFLDHAALVSDADAYDEQARRSR